MAGGHDRRHDDDHPTPSSTTPTSVNDNRLVHNQLVHNVQSVLSNPRFIDDRHLRKLVLAFPTGLHTTTYHPLHHDHLNAPKKHINISTAIPAAAATVAGGSLLPPSQDPTLITTGSFLFYSSTKSTDDVTTTSPTVHQDDPSSPSCSLLLSSSPSSIHTDDTPPTHMDDKLRGDVWRVLLGLRKPDYAELDFKIQTFIADDHLLNEPNQRVIAGDVLRTRADLWFFREPNTRREMEALLTFHCKAKTFKYKQGLNEVLAPFMYLKQSGGFSIGDVYRCFSTFVSRYLPYVFVDEEFTSVQCTFHLFKQLLLYHDPALSCYLSNAHVTPELYVTSWFLTLFASKTNMQILLCLWDFYMAQDDPYFYCFLSLALLVYSREKLFLSELSQVPERLSRLQFVSYDQLREVWSLALRLKHQTPLSFAERLQMSKGTKTKLNERLQSLESETAFFLTPIEIIRHSFGLRAPSLSSAGGCRGEEVCSWKLLLLDVRPIAEFTSGRLPPAIHIDLTRDWVQCIEELLDERKPKSKCKDRNSSSTTTSDRTPRSASTKSSASSSSTTEYNNDVEGSTTATRSSSGNRSSSTTGCINRSSRESNHDSSFLNVSSTCTSGDASVGSEVEMAVSWPGDEQCTSQISRNTQEKENEAAVGALKHSPFVTDTNNSDTNNKSNINIDSVPSPRLADQEIIDEDICENNSISDHHICIVTSDAETLCEALCVYAVLTEDFHLRWVSIADGGYRRLHFLALESGFELVDHYNAARCAVCTPLPRPSLLQWANARLRRRRGEVNGAGEGGAFGTTTTRLDVVSRSDTAMEQFFEEWVNLEEDTSIAAEMSKVYSGSRGVLPFSGLVGALRKLRINSATSGGIISTIPGSTSSISAAPDTSSDDLHIVNAAAYNETNLATQTPKSQRTTQSKGGVSCVVTRAPCPTQGEASGAQSGATTDEASDLARLAGRSGNIDGGNDGTIGTISWVILKRSPQLTPRTSNGKKYVFDCFIENILCCTNFRGGVEAARDDRGLTRELRVAAVEKLIGGFVPELGKCRLLVGREKLLLVSLPDSTASRFSYDNTPPLQSDPACDDEQNTKVGQKEHYFQAEQGTEVNKDEEQEVDGIVRVYCIYDLLNILKITSKKKNPKVLHFYFSYSEYTLIISPLFSKTISQSCSSPRSVWPSSSSPSSSSPVSSDSQPVSFPSSSSSAARSSCTLLAGNNQPPLFEMALPAVPQTTRHSVRGSKSLMTLRFEAESTAHDCIEAVGGCYAAVRRAANKQASATRT